MQLKFYHKENDIYVVADIGAPLAVIFQQIHVNGKPFAFRMLLVDRTRIKPSHQEDGVLQRVDMDNTQNPIAHLAAHASNEEYAIFLFSHSSGGFVDNVMKVKYTLFIADIRRRSLERSTLVAPLTFTNPVASIKTSPQPAAEICFTVPNMFKKGYAMQRICLSSNSECPAKLVSREKLNGNCVIDCMVVDN